MDTKMVRIVMSNKEIERLHLMEKVCSKEMKLNKAAKLLNISKSQSIRVKKRYQAEGVKGLISRKVGAPSNNRLSKEQNDLVISFLNKEEHRDFGPLLTHEYLSKQHTNFMSISSVRTLMVKEGIWKPRKSKAKKIYRLRQRKERKGELIQVDGSEHDWFEGRGARCTLLVYVDDATNKTFARFVKSENTWDYLKTTRSYIEENGRPEAFYSDKHSVFRVNREGALSGDGKTQYGRAMEEMGIRLICANSPQAKGRVERKNRDFQNRLVKAMRLSKISTIEEGNAFLPGFLQELNDKFSKTPKNPLDAHRSTLETQDLDKIFCLKHTRQISKSLTFQYGGVLYQVYGDRIEYTLRKQKVTIFEKEDGEIYIECRNKAIRAVPFKESSPPAEIVSSKELIEKLANQIKVAPQKRYKPPLNHPWKRGGKRSFKGLLV